MTRTRHLRQQKRITTTSMSPPSPEEARAALSNPIFVALFGGRRYESIQRDIHTTLIPATYTEGRLNISAAQHVLNIVLEQVALSEREQPLMVELDVLVEQREEMLRIREYYRMMREGEGTEGGGRGGEGVCKGWEMIETMAKFAVNRCNELIQVKREEFARGFRPLSWGREGEWD